MAQREKIYIVSSDRERKMAKNRGICAAHTCILQYREYPPPRGLVVVAAAAAAVAVVAVVVFVVNTPQCWYNVNIFHTKTPRHPSTINTMTTYHNKC